MPKENKEEEKKGEEEKQLQLPEIPIFDLPEVYQIMNDGPPPVSLPHPQIIKPQPTEQPKQVKPSYIENQEEKDVVFTGPNKAFEFSNYKKFKMISNINKLFVIEKELGKVTFGEEYLVTHLKMKSQFALRKICKNKLSQN